MLSLLLVVLSASLSTPSLPAAFPVTQTPVQGTNPDVAEFEKRRKAADKDTDKLWDLYEWCQQKKLDKEGKNCLRRIVQLSPNDEKAQKLLGNVAYDGKWFPSEKKVEEYKKEQASKAAKEKEKEAKEKGLVKWKDQWVLPADLPYLQKGMVRDENGAWINPEVEKKKKEGWVLQDLEWIPPAEKDNLTKGLWKCGDKWLALEEANEYHSEFFQWWKIPESIKERYTLLTTCERKTAEAMMRNLSNAYEDLVKCYGYQPAEPVRVVILGSQSQYEAFAAGDPEEERPATETHGLSSVHYAYFADVLVDPEAQQIMQVGVSYWDTQGDGPKWALHSTRHALGQSFAEALDPSPKMLGQIMSGGQYEPKEFWAEKRVPLWFRYGAAAYAERYFRDPDTLAGGNSAWAIEWSIASLVKRGGLSPLKQIFEFQPEVDNFDMSQKWINEVGMLMYFMVDGKCAPVTAKLEAFQQALKTNADRKSVNAAAKALTDEIIKNETELRKFTKL
jgi:hypothetical protein